MRTPIFALLLVGAAGLAGAQTIYRCPDKTFTNNGTDALEKGCKALEGGNITVVEGTRGPHRIPATAAETRSFRESIKVGDYSSEGLVVEVKSPVAKIQTNRGERWFRIDELYAPSKPMKSKK